PGSWSSSAPFTPPGELRPNLRHLAARDIRPRLTQPRGGDGRTSEDAEGAGPGEFLAGRADVGDVHHVGLALTRVAVTDRAAADPLGLARKLVELAPVGDLVRRRCEHLVDERHVLGAPEHHP